MRFISRSNTTINICIWIMFVISILATIFAILILNGTILADVTPAQAKLIISFCPITAAICLFLNTITYVVDDKSIKMRFMFWDIFGGKLQINKILNIVKKDNKLYISYLGEGSDPTICQISIKENKFELLTKFLQASNKNITYYDEDTNSNK